MNANAQYERRNIMNENFRAFTEGFVEGAKETPRGFFAPVIALCRWLDRIGDEAMREARPYSYERVIETVERAEMTLVKVRRQAFDRLEGLDPELHAMAVTVFGGKDAAARWMARPLRELHRRSAYEALSAGEREQVIERLIARP
jgi:hypothetical protein